MKPFFSIRIDYNPADSKQLEAFDHHSLRLTIARETQWQEGGPSTENVMNIAQRLEDAIRWLDERPGMADSLWSWVIQEMPRNTLFQCITDLCEIGDDDTFDGLKDAIERGRRRQNDSGDGDA